MSIGRARLESVIFIGEAMGFYGPRNFDKYATTIVVKLLRGLRIDTECNSEGTVGRNIIYHYPGAGVGLGYYRQERICRVSVVGSHLRKREMDILTTSLVTGSLIKK